MGRSMKAHVKPALLKWGRESIRMDPSVASKKLHVTEERLRAWEEGAEDISVAQLRLASEVYKRPLAVFFLPRPPTDFRAMRNFRRLPGVPEAPSTELMRELHLAASRRDIAEELAELIGEEPPRFRLRARLSEDALDAAIRVRASLGISLAAQHAWKDEYEALRAWRSALESLGVLVFQVSRIALQETRGFSAHFDPYPVIAMNAKDSPVARCFTLMHELGHLALHSGAVCDAQVMGDVRFDPIEVWCNEFSAGVLVPLEEFRADARAYPFDDEWPREALRELANRYKVSQEVVYRRLLTIGRASSRAYQEWRDSYEALPAKKSAGGPEFPVRLVSSSGRPFVGLALAAYNTNKITASALAGYLGTQLKHLGRIQELVWTGRGEP